MDVFRFTVVEKRWRRGRSFANLLQSLQNTDEFVGRNYAGVLQRTRMRAAGRKFVTQQPLVEAE